MQGIMAFLLVFFGACWILILGHHFGPGWFDLGVFQAGLPLAYTGGIISVGTLAVVIVGVLRG